MLLIFFCFQNIYTRSGLQNELLISCTLNYESYLRNYYRIGSFGRVMLAKNKKSGEFFAMKRLKKADIIKLRQVDHVISENTILADIDHPFLVSAIILFFSHPPFVGWSKRFCSGREVSLLPHGVYCWRWVIHISKNWRKINPWPWNVLLRLSGVDVRILS